MIFGKKIIFNFYFSRTISQDLIIASSIEPFLSYLTCIVRREYFRIIFLVKKVCTIPNKIV